MHTVSETLIEERVMQQHIHDEYINLAIFFLTYKIQAKNLTITPENMKQALLDCAPEYRPNYWRRLRRALAYSFEQLGQTDIVDALNENLEKGVW